MATKRYTKTYLQAIVRKVGYKYSINSDSYLRGEKEIRFICCGQIRMQNKNRRTFFFVTDIKKFKQKIK